MPIVNAPATIPSSLPPSGTAGGDLGGTYPNPTVDLVTGGGTLAGNVLIEKSDLSAVRATVDSTTDASLLVGATTGNQNQVTITGKDSTAMVDAWGTGRTKIHESGRVEVAPAASDSGLEVKNVAGNLAFSVIKTGQAVISAPNAAPADADLAAGQCALWFASTNGAAAFNIKAKQANGTVKTATIPVIT